jgi:hypothetical protein
VDEPLFAKVEHQYVRVGAERGHVVKVAAVFLPLRTVAVESGVARSANATFDTRQASVRVDWVHAAGRIYAGGAWGRSIPQAVDLATGLRGPENTTHQWFAGLFQVIGHMELGLLHDQQRSDFSRRRTWTATLKVAFP